MMKQARIIRRISLTDTLRALPVGGTIEVPARMAHTEVVRTTARRLKAAGEGTYECHRCEGDTKVTRLC